MKRSLCALVSTLAAALGIEGCSAYDQDRTEVAVRAPGHRVLGKPYSNHSDALVHWQFAWVSVAAYQRTSEAPKGCLTAEETLGNAKWERWSDFPDESAVPNKRELLEKMERTNLRVEVWSKPGTPSSVVVAFGGTAKGVDWRSNLRWFTFKIDDQYTQVVKDIAPAFAKEFERLSVTPHFQYIKGASLFATGHSLGGGLAQQFMYALPSGASKTFPVRQVYAFDPSPVTGFYSVAANLRNENRKGLKIDRIYQRGEILAYFRSFTSMFLKPSEVDPEIRGVRYNLFYSLNSVKDHSMLTLACDLEHAAKTDELGHSIALL